MGIEAYSTNPNANTGQMPEGQAPSTVNDGVRTIQTHLAQWYNDPQWYRPGAPAPTITRLSSNSVRVPGADVTALYQVGRAVRIQGDSTGTIYGKVASAEFTGGNTNIVITLTGSDAIESEALVVSLATAGPPEALPISSVDVAGIVKLLSAADYQLGIDEARAVTVGAMTEGWILDSTAGKERLLIRLPFGIKIEFGHNVSGAEVTFIQAYTYPPIVLVTVNPGTGIGLNQYGAASGITATRCGVHAFTQAGTQTGATVGYLAVGI